MPNTPRVITVFNKKGGTGKSGIAYSLAKDLGYALLSNDDSVIEKIYPKKAKILREIKIINHDAVYDLGGYIDVGILSLFKASDKIIVPSLLDSNSIKRTKHTVLELLKVPVVHSKIIIVVNQARQEKLSEKEESLFNVLKKLESEFGVKVMFLRRSKAIPNSMLGLGSVSDQYNNNPLSRHSYRGVFEDYSMILNEVKK